MATEKQDQIEPGFHVFIADGGSAIGGVRRVDDGHIVVNVENGGDFEVPLRAVRAVHAQKVVLSWDALEQPVRDAIGHATDREDFPPPSPKDEDALAGRDQDEEEQLERGLDLTRGGPPPDPR
jgi:hypothetical protein